MKRIPLRFCKKCPHFNEWYGCHISELSPCPRAEEIEEELWRDRFLLFITAVCALMLAGLLLLNRTTEETTEAVEPVSAVELLRKQRNELSEWDMLILAISFTESRFKTDVVGKNQDSGILQITPVYKDEVNRLYGTDYSLDDAFTIEGSLEMFNLIQEHYNPNKDIDLAIRLHNKSPQYRVAVLENLEMIKRYETLRHKLNE